MLPEANYEESEAGNLPLPSPLEGEDGGRIGTATRWNRRRAAIRAEFARIMYGELPPRPEAVRFELRRECDDAIDFLSGLGFIGLDVACRVLSDGDVVSHPGEHRVLVACEAPFEG